MRINIIGVVLGTVLGIFLLVLFPMYQIGIYEQVSAQEQSLSYTRNLIDEVIDSRQLTESTLQNFYLNIGSASSNLSAEIIRETKVVNPDPLKPGSTYVAYLANDDIYNYNQGDLITVHVYQVGSSLTERIAMSALNLKISSIDFTLTMRVR